MEEFCDFGGSSPWGVHHDELWVLLGVLGWVQSPALGILGFSGAEPVAGKYQ